MKKEYWITALISGITVLLIQEGHKHFIWVMPVFLLLASVVIYKKINSAKEKK